MDSRSGLLAREGNRSCWCLYAGCLLMALLLGCKPVPSSETAADLPTAVSEDPAYGAGNSTVGEVALIDQDTLEFRDKSGSVARLRRHDDATWPWTCM